MINILQMLENSAMVYPERIAFSDTVKEISFKELLDSTKRCASYLLDKNYFSFDIPGRACAFFMEKSVDAVTVMFAAVYSGGFYSFIDIRQPAERTRKLIDVLEPAIVVTDQSGLKTLEEYYAGDFCGLKVVLIDSLIEASKGYAINQPLLDSIRNSSFDCAPLYVNFTSGSTGVPKGVVVSHRSVCDFIEVFTKTFHIDENDSIANQAPFDFDVSVKDIYSGLLTGAKVVLIPREYFSNPTVLMDYICDNKVTNLTWAVSAMCFVSIMNGFDYRCPDTVRRIMFSGEVMPIKQLNKWKKYIPDAMYVNLYGPTEITCNCTYHILDREYEKDEVIPIGIPFINEKVFLLDENDELVTTPHTEGELCVSGTCLALGYYKDKEKTDKVFVQNPLNKEYNETIYRTGDNAKYDDDGILIYTGRKDFQIKHMGQRIELGDIEVSAMALDNVSRACCIYDFKHQKIILFVTGDVDKDYVASELKLKLPPFMMPGKTVVLEEFPMNKNGKIDRTALASMK